MPEGPAIAGRILGSVDWICPDCKTPQNTHPDWDLQSLTCMQCAKVWYLRLLIYRSTPKHPIGTPFDWTPILPFMGNKRKNEAKTSAHNPLSPSTIGGSE